MGMVKCPRCSFEQPEDVFCASCGVNMQTYRVRRSSPKVRIYVGVAAAMAAVIWGASKLGGTLDDIQKKMNFNSQIEEELGATGTPGQPQQAVTQTANQPGTVAKAPTPSAIIPFRNTAPISQNRAGSQVVGPQDSQQGLAQAPTPSPTPAEAKISNQLKTDFVLLGKESLDKLGLIPAQPAASLIARSKYDEAIRDAGNQNLASESHGMMAGQTFSVIQGGLLPTKENIGITMRITTVRLGDSTADLRIAISRSLPEVASNGAMHVVSADFTENVTLAGNQVFAISGMLPRKDIMPNEDQLYATNVLRALLDPGFQKFESEFVIFILP